MSQKRNDREENNYLDEKRPSKVPSLRSVVLEVMNLRKLQNLLEPVLEPLIRQVVKEEMDIAIRKHLISMRWNVGKDLTLTESRSLCLRFLKSISLPVFTGTRIEGQGCTTVELALVDMRTEEIVSCGLESSATVEIVVLEGDFDGYGGNWTLEEFRNNTMRDRECKKSILSGEVIMTLKNGMCLLDNISFTDNSSWTRSRKFRLGARLLDNFGGMRVREAISEPFIVRDHRGELYKKHYPPSLSDEVWRLAKISKDGAFHRRLREAKVNTVQDFLVLFVSDPTGLRNILGTGMSAKMWDVTVDHALTCTYDKKLYVYNSSTTPQGDGVIFNMIGQMMGVFSNGKCIPTEKLSDSEKADAHELVISAFKNQDKIVPLDAESMPASSSLSLIRSPSSFSNEDSDCRDFSVCKTGVYSYSQLNPTSPGRMQLECSMGSVDYPVDFIHDDTFDVGFDEHFHFPDQATDSLVYGTDSMSPFLENEYLEYLQPECSHFESAADLQSTLNSFPCSILPTHKTKWGWNVLVRVLRWWVSIKRILARKTGAKDASRCQRRSATK